MARIPELEYAIKILKKNYVQAKRPMVLSFETDGLYVAEPEIVISSSGDGIAGPELCLRIIGGRVYVIDEEEHDDG